MSGSGVSQASLLGLKALTAEHADRFKKEGRTAVKGARKDRPDKVARDPFDRPSPGLVKRLAREARNDAKRRHFADDPDGPSEDQRRAILEAKARRYEQLARGGEGLSERELAEATIDFDRKRDEWSDHSSDVDESALEARAPEEFDTLDGNDQVEYVDELGRTRVGTRKEAIAAAVAKGEAGPSRSDEPLIGQSSYAEVMKSQLIHGDQHHFPVYQPDHEALRQKYLEAEREARQHHYDSTKEVRTRGAGAYQFSLDEEERAKQMASLDAERRTTEQARGNTAARGMTPAQEARKRRLDERRALVEAKRAKLLGGADKVAALRKQREAERAEEFLKDFEREL